MTAKQRSLILVCLVAVWLLYRSIRHILLLESSSSAQWNVSTYIQDLVNYSSSNNDPYFLDFVEEESEENEQEDDGEQDEEEGEQEDDGEQEEEEDQQEAPKSSTTTTESKRQDARNSILAWKRQRQRERHETFQSRWNQSRPRIAMAQTKTKEDAVVLLSSSRLSKWKTLNTNLTTLINNSNNNNATAVWTHNGKRIVYLLHLHKSGGTTLCALARHNVFVNAEFGNCNVQPDQRCCGGRDTLEAQIRYTRERIPPPPYPVLVANERYMYNAMDTQHYFYTMVLRNSRDRYLSHWRHVMRNRVKSKTPYTPFQGWWQGNGDNERGGQPDNWNVRHICGTQCLDRPKYQLTIQDWEYTWARVLQFDSVLFLEEWETSLTRFAQQVHWHHAVDPTFVANSKPRTVSRTSVDDQSWNPFMSALDDWLYQLAQEWWSNDYHITPELRQPSLPKAVRDYFNKGPEQACLDICCGQCTKYR